MLADRLAAKTAVELKPTFSAAKITRLAKKREKELVATTKVQQRQYDQLVRLCAPVLELHNINERAFEELMKRVRQQLERLATRNKSVPVQSLPGMGEPQPYSEGGIGKRVGDGLVGASGELEEHPAGLFLDISSAHQPKF